jgi:hypothetical protein
MYAYVLPFISEKRQHDTVPWVAPVVSVDIQLESRLGDAPTRVVVLGTGKQPLSILPVISPEVIFP